MKTDREKLIELLGDFLDEMPLTEGSGLYESFADYLISKGVTIPVRCIDCRYLESDDWDGETLYCCVQGMNMGDVTPNTYCCYGERKDT